MTATKADRMEVELSWRERTVQSVLAGLILAALLWVGHETSTLGKQMAAFEMWREDTQARLDRMEMKR